MADKKSRLRSQAGTQSPPPVHNKASAAPAKQAAGNGSLRSQSGHAAGGGFFGAKFHGIPVYLLVPAGGVLVYALYTWYKNRSSSTASTTSTTPSTATTPTQGYASTGAGSGGGGSYPWSGGYPFGGSSTTTGNNGSTSGSGNASSASVTPAAVTSGNTATAQPAAASAPALAQATAASVPVVAPTSAAQASQLASQIGTPTSNGPTSGSVAYNSLVAQGYTPTQALPIAQMIAAANSGVAPGTPQLTAGVPTVAGSGTVQATNAASTPTTQVATPAPSWTTASNTAPAGQLTQQQIEATQAAQAYALANGTGGGVPAGFHT